MSSSFNTTSVQGECEKKISSIVAIAGGLVDIVRDSRMYPAGDLETVGQVSRIVGGTQQLCHVDE
jgi:hypothetical protein